MHTLNVEFNNIDNESLDLHCISCGRRQRAQEKIETQGIPDSNQDYVEHSGFYEPYNRAMQFAWKDKLKTADIYKWLRGYAKLRTSKDPGGYFKANVMSGYDVDKFSKRYDEFQAVFKINPPFFYLDSGEVPITLTTPGTITNPGTHVSEPLIRIVGSGNITLTINGRTLTFTNIETFIDIDPELAIPYFKNNVNVGEKVVGDLPYFDVGDNEISWTGSVSEINILGRWREL